MPIQPSVVAWFSQLVWKIQRCEDERSLFDEIVRSLSARCYSLSTGADVCHAIGLGQQVSDVFGLSASSTLQKKPQLVPREQLIIGQIKRHAQMRIASLRSTSAQQRQHSNSRLSLSAHGAADKIPARIRQLLAHYFPRERSSVATGRLPDEVRRWLRFSTGDTRKLPITGAKAPLQIEGPRGFLTMHLSQESSLKVIALHISEERRKPDIFALRALGFTPRQCEVVHWLMTGKRELEIAGILGCSSRTVAGYVATMLRKTRASNRQAAVYILRQWLRTRGRTTDEH